jgi:hypothetical protein
MKIGNLSMYMYLPILALVIGIGFVFFSKDTYRYECQDPTNWNTPECIPPLCKASGTCTEDLLNLESSIIEEITAMSPVEATDVVDQEEAIDTAVTEAIEDYSCESNCNPTEEEINDQ